MSRPPDRPKIYHITPIENLLAVVTAGELVCDEEMVKRGGPAVGIGMSRIKTRRLTLPVSCHRGDMVGDYVPFYFCPRSIMLFVIYKANDPDLAYRGGQVPILHLESDLHEAITWAGETGRRWAFSLSNASARYAEFLSSAADLPRIDWTAVASTGFQDSDVKEAKQAEFLMFGAFPWALVSRIGVISGEMKRRAEEILSGAPRRPVVEVLPEWYY